MNTVAHRDRLASRRRAPWHANERCHARRFAIRTLSALSLSLLLVTLGCESTTAPVANQTRLYVLADIDGQAIPATTGSQVGDTTTVLWGTVTLDANGRAVVTQHYRYVWRNYPPDTSTLVLVEKYMAAHDSITVGSFARCPDLCAPNMVGQLSDSTLTLTYDVLPRSDAVYRYRLSTTYQASGR